MSAEDIIIITQSIVILFFLFYSANESRKKYRYAKIIKKESKDVYSLHGFHSVEKILMVEYVDINNAVMTTNIVTSEELYENSNISDCITVKI